MLLLLGNLLFLAELFSSSYVRGNAIDGTNPDVSNTIFNFLKLRDLSRLRQMNSNTRRQVDAHLKLERLHRDEIYRFGLSTALQLKCLLASEDEDDLRKDTSTPPPVLTSDIVEKRARSPYTKDHIKLLNFIKCKLRDIHCRLKHDHVGFILPMISFYTKQIHGLDPFIDIYDLESPQDSEITTSIPLFAWELEDLRMIGAACRWILG